MTERNAWAKTADTPQAEDVEAVEAERVLTLVELEGKPIEEQLAALNGGPISSLTAQELAWVQGLSRWYGGACMTAGVPMPPDLLRCLAALGNEVVSYNVALAAQGDDGAMPMPTEH